MSKNFVSIQQLELLPERIKKADETDATKELRTLIFDLFKKNDYKPMNVLIVGAGNSYPVALFAKYTLHEEMSIPNIEALTPQAAIRMLNKDNYDINYTLVIGISYSGKTSDIKCVSEICIKRGFPFVLLTGAKKSTLSNIYTEDFDIKIISYSNENDTSGKEEGIISMASTLAPAIILDDNWSSKLISENQKAIEDGKEFVSNLNIVDIAKAIKKHSIIHVFYEWDTLPTAADIKNKFTTSGIANVVLHDKKNFSHGSYNLLYKQDFALVINLVKLTIALASKNGSVSISKVYSNQYNVELAKFLDYICSKKSANYIEIGTAAMMSSQWNIEAMAILPFLITAIGEELNVDVSKPINQIPKEANALYTYRGLF